MKSSLNVRVKTGNEKSERRLVNTFNNTTFFALSITIDHLKKTFVTPRRE